MRNRARERAGLRKRCSWPDARESCFEGKSIRLLTRGGSSGWRMASRAGVNAPGLPPQAPTSGVDGCLALRLSYSASLFKQGKFSSCLGYPVIPTSARIPKHLAQRRAVVFHHAAPLPRHLDIVEKPVIINPPRPRRIAIVNTISSHRKKVPFFDLRSWTLDLRKSREAYSSPS